MSISVNVVCGVSRRAPASSCAPSQLISSPSGSVQVRHRSIHLMGVIGHNVRHWLPNSEQSCSWPIPAGAARASVAFPSPQATENSLRGRGGQKGQGARTGPLSGAQGGVGLGNLPAQSSPVQSSSRRMRYTHALQPIQLCLAPCALDNGRPTDACSSSSYRGLGEDGSAACACHGQYSIRINLSVCLCASDTAGGCSLSERPSPSQSVSQHKASR